MVYLLTSLYHIDCLCLFLPYKTPMQSYPSTQCWFWWSYKWLKHNYVALSDPGSIKCCHIIKHSPENWETTVGQNVDLRVFHTQNICHHTWKTLRITLWCFVVLQSRGKGLKSKENYETDLSHSFFSISWPSPRDWRQKMHCNVVLTVFHAWWYIFCVWEIVRTTFRHIVVFQLRGDCSIMWKHFMDPGSESTAYGPI